MYLKARSDRHREFARKERGFFNKESESLGNSYESFIGQMKRNKIFAGYKNFVRNSKYILEIGCGSGDWTKRMYRYNSGIFACDISENMIKIAKKKCPGANFVQADVLDVPFKNSSFDLLFVADIVHHLVEQDGIYDELERLLASRGHLIIDEPNKLARFSLHCLAKKIKTILPEAFWNRFFAKRDIVMKKNIQSPVEKMKMHKSLSVTPHGIDPFKVASLLKSKGFNIVKRGYYNASIVGVPSYLPESISKFLILLEVFFDSFFNRCPRANLQCYIIARRI